MLARLSADLAIATRVLVVLTEGAASDPMVLGAIKVGRQLELSCAHLDINHQHVLTQT